VKQPEERQWAMFLAFDKSRMGNGVSILAYCGMPAC